jgi:ribose 1,5-bisphosphate isomerase
VNEQVKAIAHDIERMKIRGAAKIAKSAAQGLLVTAQQSNTVDPAALTKEIEAAARFLLKTRPTAISLANSVRHIMFKVKEGLGEGLSVEELRARAVSSANGFIKGSETAVKLVGRIGARRIEDGDRVMTHCNSAAAISVLRTAHNQGKHFEVTVCETRPRFQGRITARTLSKVGVPTTLITDGAARFFMAKMDKAIVGADAVAANGAIVNKVGTSMVALAAREARVLFFVAAETYKFSPETVLGQLVKIEERASSEVIPDRELRKMQDVQVRNPSFDVTPPEYIDLIITEKGIIPPQAAIMIIQEEYGSITPDQLMEYQTYGSDRRG